MTISPTANKDSITMVGSTTPKKNEKRTLLSGPPSPMVPEDMNELVQSDDENDFVPLVHNSGMSFRRHAFEISIARDDDIDSDGYYTGLGKVFASLLLASLLLAPFVYSYYTSEYHDQTFRRPFLTAADQLDCAKQLGISFSELYTSKQKDKTGYCRTNFTKELGALPCRCQNPTLPRETAASAMQRNRDMIQQHWNASVVFLGNSIIERFAGTSVAEPIPSFNETVHIFQSLFGSFGFPLGIAGDRSNQLLYRIQNGEAPPSLEPRVWWVLIGTNDFWDQCNRGTVLVGILAVLQELRQRRPNANIVINGILPRGQEQLEDSLLWQDTEWINERLKCLGSLERIEYFDASSIFLTDDKKRINQTLMSDYLHPSSIGSLLWGQAMLDRLQDLEIDPSTEKSSTKS